MLAFLKKDLAPHRKQYIVFAMNMKDVEHESTEEQFYRDVTRLLRHVNKTLKNIGPNHPNYSGLCDAAADVEGYYDAFETPRSMGWVANDGRP